VECQRERERERERERRERAETFEEIMTQNRKHQLTDSRSRSNKRNI
jgi:hypothetical protein